MSGYAHAGAGSNGVLLTGSQKGDSAREREKQKQSSAGKAQTGERPLNLPPGFENIGQRSSAAPAPKQEKQHRR